MQRPPPLSEVSRFPITGLLCGAAAGITLAYFQNHANILRLVMTPEAFTTEPWRLVTTVLPHGDAAHLFFNLYWTWALGSILERAFGHVRYLLFIVLAAAFSSSADWALSEGGIGLSGVGYGLFGVLWALRRTQKYAGIIDKRTSTLFIVWFFACIVMTYFGWMRVANVAHGAGLVIGVIVGCAVRSKGALRLVWCAAAAALCGAAWLGATAYRPMVNLANWGLGSSHASLTLANQALQEQRYLDALPLLERVVEKEPSNAAVWKVIGWVYYFEVGDDKRAADAWEKGLALTPGDTDMARYLQAARTALDPARPRGLPVADEAQGSAPP